MPRIKKIDPIEGVRLASDIMLVNEKTGPRGKLIPAGSYQITNLRTGAQWFVSPADFHGSGWGADDESEQGYFTRR